jgi:hypothetical protein
MDSPNTTSGQILQATNRPTSIGSSVSSTSTSINGSSNGSFFSGFLNVGLNTWLIIIVILLFLGFNIFSYLAKGTEEVGGFFEPIIKQFYNTISGVTGQAVDVSAEGAKQVVGGTAGAINASLESVQQATPNKASSSVKGQSVQNTLQQPDVLANNVLNKALNTSNNQKQGQNNNDYQPNDASSTINSSGKPGWCYVGEDKGYRTCAQVGANDECMSGDIFPSQELCMNPNLRA